MNLPLKNNLNGLNRKINTFLDCVGYNADYLVVNYHSYK